MSQPNRPFLLRPAFLPVCAAVVITTAVFSFKVRADEPIKPDTAPVRGKPVLIIKESRDAQTFNAEDQDVTVQGSNNKITIKGTCHALTLSGNDNKVSVAAVASIALSGTGNQVKWNEASGGEKPQITDLGKDNEVSHSAKD